MTENYTSSSEQMQKDTYDEVEYVEIKNPFGFIYITTNLVNGKRYIGQRKFSDGWKPYLGSGKRFKEAVKKYGRENFVRSIVDIAYSREELNAKEINLIKFLNAVDSRNFYNISDGGEIKGKNGKDAYWYNKQLPREIIEQIMKDTRDGANWSFDNQSVDGIGGTDLVHLNSMKGWVMYPTDETIVSAKSKINEILK